MLATLHKPQSETGQSFRELCVHRFNFIEAGASNKPDGKTISQYPIEHQDLEQMGGHGA